jgi:hypothetical protein
MTRTATCRCGAVTVTCEGEPVRISACHCLACKQRSGSAFAAQARFPNAQVRVAGETRTWTRIADSGNPVHYRFCPTCGSTVAYALERDPDVIAVPMGNFADPGFPAPRFSVWEKRKHDWVAILGDEVEHSL